MITQAQIDELCIAVRAKEFSKVQKLMASFVSDLNDIAQQPHYTQWKIQPITFITANALNFCQGNVIKYVMRYKAKNGLEDLKKAKVYIDYLIQELETGEVKP